MNQKIVDYLRSNKDQYSQDSLVAQLRSAGHSEQDISDAVSAVYDVVDTTSPQLSVANNNVGQVKYAGFLIRLIAVIIDGIIIIGLGGAVFAIPATFVLQTEVLIAIVGMIIGVLYSIFMTINYQATLGKMAMGIKVCDAETLGKRKSDKIVVRELMNGVLPGVPFLNVLYVLISAVMIVLSSKKRGIADLAAGTVVIYKKANNNGRGIDDASRTGNALGGNRWISLIIFTILMIIIIPAVFLFLIFFLAAFFDHFNI